MPVFQLVATLFSLLYIFLAVKNKPICFLFGLLASLAWAYEDFVNLNLNYDGVLQLFYAGISIWGWFKWNEKQNQELGVIKKLTWNQIIMIVGFACLFSILVAFIGVQFFNSALPYLDALTTGFSIIASFLLIYRYIDHWVFWVAIDLCYVYIYGQQAAWIFAGLMLVYTLLSIVGWVQWKKLSIGS